MVVCDGAMGTMLHSLGVTLGQSFDELNISRPDVVASVHQRYVDAGAQIIETNTFGANPLKLESHGLGHKARDINVAGARIAKGCADARVLTAGSVGPTGKLMQPFGPLSFDQAYEAYREQIVSLCEGGVDLLIIETIQDLREVKAALLAAKSVTEIPVICQMSFPQEGRTLMGTDPATAAVVLEGLGAALIGANCSTGPQDMLDAILAMAAVSGVGLTAQPNAGLPRFFEGRLIYLSTPEYMAEFAQRFVEAGAVLVGGCCGTTPEHIRALSAAVAGMQRVKRSPEDRVRLASRAQVVEIGGGRPVLIGNRLGPDASAEVQTDMRDARYVLVQEETAAQLDDGAEVICLGCDAAGPGEAAGRLVEFTQSACQVALCVAGSNLEGIEHALRSVEGRALVFAGGGSQAALSVLPIAAQYGAVVIADVSQDGQTSPEEKLRSARRILEVAEKQGLGSTSILIKPGELFTESGRVNEETLRAMRLIKSDLKVCTLVECRPGDPKGDEAAAALKSFVDAGVDALVGDPSSSEIKALNLSERLSADDDSPVATEK